MNDLTIVLSIIAIGRLLTYERESPSTTFKRPASTCAFLIICIMAYQLICLMIDGKSATLIQFIVTLGLAGGAVYYEGNVSHLVKGLKKCVRSGLNLIR